MPETVNLSGGRTVTTFSDEELKYVQAKEDKKKALRDRRKQRDSPRPSYSKRKSHYGLDETYPEENIMEKTKLKKGHEPWPEQEKKVMQLGIDQLIQKKDSMRQELLSEKTGLNEMDKEIQVNIDAAALKVKAANMDLASMLFDQKCGITIKKHENRAIELEQEIERHSHNIEVFTKQLDEGRPKREEPKPAQDRVMSQEEFDLKKQKEADKIARQSKEEKVRQEKNKPDTKA